MEVGWPKTQHFLKVHQKATHHAKFHQNRTSRSWVIGSVVQKTELLRPPFLIQVYCDYYLPSQLTSQQKLCLKLLEWNICLWKKTAQCWPSEENAGCGNCVVWEARTVVSRYPVKHPDTERKDKFQHLANNNITLFPPQLSCHMHFYLLIRSFLFHFLPVKGNIILSKFLI